VVTTAEDVLEVTVTEAVVQESKGVEVMTAGVCFAGVGASVVVEAPFSAEIGFPVETAADAEAPFTPIGSGPIAGFSFVDFVVYPYCKVLVATMGSLSNVPLSVLHGGCEVVLIRIRVAGSVIWGSLSKVSSSSGIGNV
jgi:hypothetical protein